MRGRPRPRDVRRYEGAVANRGGRRAPAARGTGRSEVRCGWAAAAKAEGGSIFVLEGWQEPKTRAAADCLRAAEIEGKVLIVLDPESPDEAHVDRAFRNLAGAAFSLHGSLSAYDALAADAIVFTSKAFERFAERSQAGVQR